MTASKSQHYQSIGLMPQFEQNHDLQVLKMNVNQHMETHELSLLKYLPHPNNNAKVVNLTINHRLLEKKKLVKEGNMTATKHYNSHEQANQ